MEQHDSQHSMKFLGIVILLVMALLASEQSATGSNFNNRPTSHAQRSNSWPRAEGEWMRRVEVDETAQAARTTPLPPEARPGVELVYRYRVNDKVHYNNTRGFGPANETAEAIFERFPREQVWPVYYDPVNPDVSVLAPGIRPSIWIVPAIGVVFFGIGALAFVPVKRRAASAPAQRLERSTASVQRAPARPERRKRRK